MAIVKIHNDNVHPHKEMYKGALVEIPAGGVVEMEYEEAVQFLGQFTGVAPLGADQRPDPRFFKKLRLSEVPKSIDRDDSLVNMATGKREATHDALVAALAEFSDRRAPVDREAEVAAKSEVEKLRAELAASRAEVAAMAEKRGPGRPRKEA